MKNMKINPFKNLLLIILCFALSAKRKTETKNVKIINKGPTKDSRQKNKK
jgi:hypothetical protein